MAGGVDDISDGNFEAEVLKSSVPVLVDFWAPWCGPCKSIAPVLEQLATEYAGKLRFVKMNVDDNPSTPSQLNVQGIPNLVVFRDGQVIDRIVGAVPKEQLKAALDKHVA
jgi:thioredoxin 1